ncbi:MAG: PDZ domain-containing protein, partial [Myxococcales bacterium]|nr:PDZ domain-containing protein [Myxococcales bacterium]
GVDPGSLAERAGLREGDVIAQIDGVAVASAAEAGARLRAADLRKGVRLRIIRGDYGRFVVLRDQG